MYFFIVIKTNLNKLFQIYFHFLVFFLQKLAKYVMFLNREANF